MRFACLGLVLLVPAVLSGCGGPKKAAGPVAPAEKLKFTDTKVGTGLEAKYNDFVTVEYVGKLQNGKQFDANWGGTKIPFTFMIGGDVIKGWNEGIPGMREGGERDLIVPPSLGYGSDDKGNIPPNSTLLFHVKLLGVLKQENARKVQYSHDDTVGTGPAVHEGNIVTIAFKATCLNGYPYDQAPKYSFEVGPGWVMPNKDGRVIAGVNQGVVGMKKGGRRTLVLPPALTTATRGVGDQSQTLRFVIDMLDVK